MLKKWRKKVEENTDGGTRGPGVVARRRDTGAGSLTTLATIIIFLFSFCFVIFTIIIIIGHHNKVGKTRISFIHICAIIFVIFLIIIITTYSYIY